MLNNFQFEWSRCSFAALTVDEDMEIIVPADITLPGYTPASGGENPPPGGMRGEVAGSADLERPDLRREVAIEGRRKVVVEDSSGTAFAEAAGVAGLITPTASQVEAVAPSPPPVLAMIEPGRPTPALFAAAFVAGVLLAMLTGSSRRVARDGSPFTE